MKGLTIMGTPHVLLLAGSAATPLTRPSTPCPRVTDTVSVVYITAWRPSGPVRADWEQRGLRGEFLDVPDLDAAVLAAADLHGRLPLDGVVTYSELLLRPQAEIASRLGLPGNPPEAVAVAQSKAGSGWPSPRTGCPRPSSRSSPASGTSRRPPPASGLPGVFKPSLGGGQPERPAGVHVRRTHPRLHRRARREDRLPPGRRGVLLEQRMALETDGDSGYAAYCSVESLLADGTAHHLAVADRLPLEHALRRGGRPAAQPAGRGHPGGRRRRRRPGDPGDRTGLGRGAHRDRADRRRTPRHRGQRARRRPAAHHVFEVAAGYDYSAEIGRAALGLSAGRAARFTRVACCGSLPIPVGNWRVAAQTPVEEVLRAFPELVYVSPRFTPRPAVSRQRTLHLVSFMVNAPTGTRPRAVTRQVERALDIRLVPGFDATTGADRD
ncbi:hypothetical protein GCM10023238_36670 [Streptomyces heliomycini]